ncbi:MAG: insulinase family protein [Verrucomicrobia bacterium]|nr:MAG: insulinase family protein [Verrucomicrobiota bacterium]
MDTTRLLSDGLRPEDIPPVPEGVELVTLDNGLTIIVREDHSAPVVAAQVWCRAGSIDEGRWLGAGLSHVLEHMLFKGTETRPPGRIDREVQEAGGYMNAYTSFDRTVYWINVPNTGWEVAVDVLADITQHATLPPEELAKEMDVIRREMDMSHDDPARHSSRRLFEVAYTRSPYRHPIIGHPDIFNRLTREDIVAYYREKYAPNNLFFVVVGDVDPGAVVERLRRAFAGTPAQPLPPTVLPSEPPQVAPRELTEEGQVELTHVHYAWHVPDLRHPDTPLLDVLMMLLGGGRSSRLHREVQRNRGLVTSIDAWLYSPGNTGLAGVSAVLEADKFEAADEAIRDQISRLQEELVSGDELRKAAKQFVAGTLASRKTMQGQAQDLGANWMAAGDLNFSARYLLAARQAAPEALRRVAREYLALPKRTRYALAPRGSRPTAPRVLTRAQEGPVRKVELPNGLRLLLKEDRRLPFVEFQLVVRGGVLSETVRNNGITHLLARMLLQGAGGLDGEEIATRIESVGGHLDSFSGNHSFGLSAETLRDDLTMALELLALVLLQPTFPADHLERERAHQLAAIRAQRDQMLPWAFRLMRRRMFGPHGYGLDVLGLAESVRRLDEAALRRAHRRLVRPDRAVLAVYGDIDAEGAHRAVESVFGSWQAAPEERRSEGGEVDPPEETAEAAGDKKQAVVVVGFPGTTMASDDRLALQLIQEANSDMGSRLFTRIREELGLAYYVGCQNFTGLEPGYLALYAGTSPEAAARVVEALREEAARLAAEGLDEDELRRAKAKLIGHKRIARQDLGYYATLTALDELYGLGYERVDREDAAYEAVTPEEVAAAARQYLRLEKAVEVVLRPKADAGGSADGESR